MTTAWVVISIILGIIWLIAFVVGVVATLIPSNWRTTEERNEFFMYFAAIMAGALVFVFIHWILLLLAIPVFFLYGLVVGTKLLIKKPWREEA